MEAFNGLIAVNDLDSPLDDLPSQLPDQGNIDRKLAPNRYNLDARFTQLIEEFALACNDRDLDAVGSRISTNVDRLGLGPAPFDGI